MRLKNYIPLCTVAALLYSLIGCQNDVNFIGGSIQPEDDVVKVFADTFKVESKTFSADSVYSKVPYGLLGIFDDPMFGELTADYMAQFYLPEDFYFSHTIIDNKVDSVVMRLYYTTFMGDSLNPMEVSVYELDKELDDSRFTNVDPAVYCKKEKLLGKSFYTVKNFNQSDSLKGSSSNYPFVQIRMPDALAQRVLNKDVPQIYVTNSFGRGTVLNIDYTDLLFFYKYTKTYKDVNGNDSVTIQNGTRTLSVTKEVLQLNRFKNEIPIEHTLKNDTSTFLKTPAGLFTEVIFPADKVKELFTDKTINAVKFNLPCYRPYTSKYVSRAPSYILMVEKSKINDFFKNEIKHNGKTSFLATLDSTRTSVGSGYTFQYNFSNIGPYFSQLMKKSDKEIEEGVHVAILPVYAETDATTGAVTRLRSMIYPSAVQLKKGQERGKITVIYSEFPK